ncbi:MAG: hypothetical protein GY834_03615 [Bacteroidetes bacterium]|nr:hypothetical protein [Bacteroidota bacterium]
MSKNPKFPASDTSTLFKLSDFDKKAVEVKSINEQISHDGGLLLLNEVENQLGLVERLARCINDLRHQGYLRGALRETAYHPSEARSQEQKP